MPTRTHVRDSNIWRPIKNIYVRHNDNWVKAKKVWANRNGVWELVHVETVTVNITSDRRNINLNTEVSNILGFTQTEEINVELVVPPGVIVGSEVTFTVVGAGYGRRRVQDIQGPSLVINQFPTVS